MSLFRPNGTDLLILQKLENLHQEHLLILKQIGNTSDLVTPELEKQVLRAAALTLSIDRKVPDNN